MCRVALESPSKASTNVPLIEDNKKEPSSPTNRKRHGRYSKRNKTKKSQNSLSVTVPPEHRYVAMDCEMVGIGPDGTVSSPACVTMINWKGSVILHAYIRQTEPVTDYRTHVSGITEKHLSCAKLSLEECRAIVLQHLHNRILVGHALKNDLTALCISHPWWLIRDTAEYEPFMKYCHSSHGGEGLWPRKLKDLALRELGKHIQKAGKPHNSWEDAFAALNLYQKVRGQWEQDIVEKTKKQMDLEYQRLRQEQEMFFVLPHVMQQQYQQLAHEQQMYFMQQQQWHQQEQQMFFIQQQHNQQQQQNEQIVQ